MRSFGLLTSVVMTRILFAQAEDTPGKGTNVLITRGDEAVAVGDLPSALEDYTLALDAGRDRDAGLLKKIAELHQWMRHFSEAKEILGSVIARNPDDGEALENLQRLEIRRSLHFAGGYGEGDIDYVTRTFRLGASYGGVDWMDLQAGYSMSSKAAYDRVDRWVESYIFPSYLTYLRIALREKVYSYSLSEGATPDNNAYARVPDIQLEVGHYYSRENHASVEGELFTPSFFRDRNAHASNYKIGAAIRNWIARPLYLKLFASLLHDPDPGSLVMDQTTQRVVSFGYESVALLGGAVGFDNDRVNIEVKYVPDRDLDRSLDWSVFNTIRVNMEEFGLQYDFLYDRYPSSPGRSFSSSQVHMLAGIAEPALFMEMKWGVKTLIRDVTRLVPFLSLRFKTGV